MIIFLDLPNVQVEGAEGAEEIILTLRTTSPTASCPSCGTASSRIQSRSTRTLHDLPSVGHPIRLIMHVRRFSVKGALALKRFLWNDFPNSAILMRSRTKRLQEAL